MRTQISRRARMVVLVMALTIAGTGSLAGPTAAADGVNFSARPWLELAFGANQLFPAIGELADLVDGETTAINYGSDGRLTFLLAGSDSRFSAVSRTDAIMIMSIKGNTISAASIPRDTARIPKPGGGLFSGKVNGILRQLVSSEGSVSAGLVEFEKVIENLLQIQIDYHALIWFTGFTTLVGKVDPIYVNIGTAVRDGKHHDLDHSGPAGVYFPRANNHSLYAWNPSGYAGSPYCNGAFKNYTDPASHPEVFCHRALPYVRTRKGPGNNDFVRARRQQGFVAAAIKAVSSAELSGLASTAQAEGNGKWWTNYPLSLSSAQELYNALNGGSLVHQVVFKPTLYSARISGTSSYELKLSAVRAWCNQYMS